MAGSGLTTRLPCNRTSTIREPLLFNKLAEMASAGRHVAGRLPRRLILAFLVAGLQIDENVSCMLIPVQDFL